MRRITDTIYFIEAPFFEFPYCHCLLIKDERTCLIDTAMLPHHLQEVKESFRIDLILNTHGHLDHVNRNGEFTAPAYIHPLDAIWAESPDKLMECFGFTGFGEYELGRWFLQWGRWSGEKPSGFFNPGDIIELGRNRLEVLHLPGHSPGHCGFFFPDEGILFAGDIDLTEFGPYYGNAVSDIDEFLASLDRLIELQPDMIVAGHGDGVVKRNIRQRLREYRDIIFYREEKLMARLKQAGKVTLDEIARWKTVYGKYRYPREYERLYFLMEKYMDLHHLNRLCRMGKVTQEGDYFAATTWDGRVRYSGPGRPPLAVPDRHRETG